MLNDEGINPLDYLRVVLRYWWLLILGPVAGGALAYAYTNQDARIYQSGTSVLVQRVSGFGAVGLVDIQLSQQLASTYSELILVDSVMEEASEVLGGNISPEELEGWLSVSVSASTRILRISARYTDPDTAAAMANTVAQVFIDRTERTLLAQLARMQAGAQAQGLRDIDTILAAQVSAQGSLTLIDPAKPNSTPVEPRPAKTAVIGAVLGLLVVIAAALLIEMVRDPLGNLEELERQHDVTGIGVVWHYAPWEVRDPKVAILDNPTGPVVETFRHLLANLRFATATRQAKTVLITSPRASEGKSTVVSNIAVTAAMAGIRVTVVESDLRRPSLSTRLGGVKGHGGLSGYLASADASPADAMTVPMPEDAPNLRVIFAGPVPPNPAELLGTPRLGNLLEVLADDSDLVLIDSPPVMAVADPLIVLNHADAVILVVDEKMTKGSHLKEALRAVKRVGGHVAGVIVNNSDRRWSGYGYGYYQYGAYAEGADSPNGTGARSLGRKVGRALRIGRRA